MEGVSSDQLNKNGVSPLVVELGEHHASARKYGEAQANHNNAHKGYHYIQTSHALMILQLMHALNIRP